MSFMGIIKDVIGVFLYFLVPRFFLPIIEYSFRSLTSRIYGSVSV